MMHISGPKGNKTRTIAQCWKILQGGRPLLEEKSQDSGGLLQSTWVEGSSRAVVVSGLTEPPAYARIMPSASAAIFFPHLTCLPSYDQHNTQGWEPRHLSRWPGFNIQLCHSYL